MKNLIIIIAVMSVLLISFHAIADDTFSYKEYTDGKIDGKGAVKKVNENFGWFLGGIAFGPLTLSYAIQKDYDIPFTASSNLAGKSFSYSMGFFDGYKKKQKANNGCASCLGWSTWILLYYIYSLNK